MSSAPAILEKLNRLCDKTHEHQHLVDGRAKEAAVYPPQLCRAILRGIDKQRLREGKGMCNSIQTKLDSGGALYDLSPDAEQITIDDVDPRGLKHEEEELSEHGEAWGESYQDNLSGEALPPHLVRAARREEIDFMLDWQVWEEVPLEECWRVTGKGPLGSRWVDVNKGDDAEPNVRSRFVAKEIAFYKDCLLYTSPSPRDRG